MSLTMAPSLALVLLGWAANAIAVAHLVHGEDLDDPEIAYVVRYYTVLAAAPWACVLATFHSLCLDGDR